MMRKIIFLLLIVCLLIISLGYSDSQIKVYNIPLLEQGITLDMPLNRYSFWFYLSPNVELIDNCYLNLYYSFSEALLKDESFITIYINGKPLISKKITKPYIPFTNIKVKIPKYLFKTGFNEILISTRQRSIEGLCKDIDNDANWIVLHNSSILHIETKDKPYQLRYFPYPFINSLATNPVNFKFYLPKNITEEEIETLLSLAHYFGKIEKYKNLKYEVFLQDPLKANNENQILIGYFNKWNTLKKDLAIYKLNKDDGILYMRKYEDNIQLYISGIEKGLKKALYYIVNPNQTELIEKNPVIITSEPIKEKPQEVQKKFIKLRDLGYNDILISGVYHQGTSLYLNLPTGIDRLKDGSFIELRFSHSPALDPQKSIITIYIDHSLIKSEKLDGKNVENGVLRIYIPKDKLAQKAWNIDIKTYHYLPGADCDKRYHEVAWTKIDSDSLIYINEGERKYPNLQNLWKGDSEDIYIWFPKEISSYELSVISTIVGKIGQNTTMSQSYHVILGDEIDSNILKDKTIIFLGDFYDERIKKIKENLWVIPERDKFTVKKDLGFYFDGFTTEVIFQANHSALGKKGVLYSILYNNFNSLIKLNNLLEKKENIDKIYGQVSIFTKLGIVKSVNLFKEGESWVSIFEIRPILLYLLIFLISVIITIIAIYYARRT